MIRLGVRLAVAGGREAATRLGIIAFAVALGVGLLLATVAGVHAVDAQNQRYAWLNTGMAPAAADGSTTADPVWWLLRTDRFDGDTIYRVDVAAIGPRAPIPPGLPRLPGPGEFYASPALRTLLAATPAEQLADRFPGGGHRHDRRVRPAGPGFAADRGRTPARPTRPAPRRRAGHQHHDHRPEPVRRLPDRGRQAGDPGDAVGGGGRDPVPDPDVHRDRHPAHRDPPGATVRRDAAGRCDPPADLGGLGGRVGGRRGRRDRRRLRPVRRVPPGAGRDPVHRRAVLPRRPVGGGGRHPAGRARHPGRGGGRDLAGAAPGADLPARDHSAGHPAPASGLAADPARSRPRRARLPGRAAPGDHERPADGVPVRVPAGAGRAGGRRAVADHARLPGPCAAHSPTRPAGRRAAAVGQPAGRLPRGQRAGGGAVRHQRGHRADRHGHRQPGRPAEQYGGRQRPDQDVLAGGAGGGRARAVGGHDPGRAAVDPRRRRSAAGP